MSGRFKITNSFYLTMTIRLSCVNVVVLLHTSIRKLYKPCGKIEASNNKFKTVEK